MHCKTMSIAFVIINKYGDSDRVACIYSVIVDEEANFIFGDVCQCGNSNKGKYHCYSHQQCEKLFHAKISFHDFFFAVFTADFI